MTSLCPRVLVHEDTDGPSHHWSECHWLYSLVYIVYYYIYGSLVLAYIINQDTRTESMMNQTVNFQVYHCFDLLANTRKNEVQSLLLILNRFVNIYILVF